EELIRLFGTEDAAKQFLGSPEAVTRALRDYVWSIGVNGGTAPVEPKTPPVQAETGFGAAPAPSSARTSAAGGR
ncbi:MAG TPA: hypothetical protein VGO79_14725, partial [Thermoanaerobaculia bacterium]